MLGAHFFYQVSEEEITHAQTLAGLLEIPAPHAIGIALVLKRAAVRVSGSDGVIPGDAAAWCAAHAAWPQADAKRLLGALLSSGHVLAIAGPCPGHSVAFLGPLKAMEETSKKRSEAGRKGAEARKLKGGYSRAMAEPQPGFSHGMARDGKKETETETETENQKDSSFPAADIRRAGESIATQPNLPGVGQDTSPNEQKPPAKRRKAPAPTHGTPEAPESEPGPFKAATDMLCRVYEEVRKAKYDFGMDATRNGKAIRELLWGAGCKVAPADTSPLVELAEIERRWRIGLAWKGFPACNAIWDLRQHWTAYAQPQGGTPTRQQAIWDTLQQARLATLTEAGLPATPEMASADWIEQALKPWAHTQTGDAESEALGYAWGVYSAQAKYLEKGLPVKLFLSPGVLLECRKADEAQKNYIADLRAPGHR